MPDQPKNSGRIQLFAYLTYPVNVPPSPSIGGSDAIPNLIVDDSGKSVNRCINQRSTIPTSLSLFLSSLLSSMNEELPSIQSTLPLLPLNLSVVGLNPFDFAQPSVGRKRPHLQSGRHAPLLDGSGTSENGPPALMIVSKVEVPIPI
jgi:hypothetical protein